MTAPYGPSQVMPPDLARAVDPFPYWFVIGGQAVRCFAPYRPSRDVDFGVGEPANLGDLVDQLSRRGRVEIQERSSDTVHLLWNGDQGLRLRRAASRRLTSKTGASTSRASSRRNCTPSSIADCAGTSSTSTCCSSSSGSGSSALPGAVRRVYRGELDDGLMLRALTYFDDADREAALPGEGRSDWRAIKDYFLKQVGALLTPPMRRLEIQAQTVDVDTA